MRCGRSRLCAVPRFSAQWISTFRLPVPISLSVIDNVDRRLVAHWNEARELHAEEQRFLRRIEAERRAARSRAGRPRHLELARPSNVVRLDLFH
jgi:hypothetical protein